MFTCLVQEVCHDANLRVSLTKVLKLDSLVLVLFLTNQKQHKLTDISVMVNPPLNLKVHVFPLYPP